MPDENWQKVREVFDGALRQQPEERQNFIITACGNDKALLKEVESLFSFLAQSDEFLETPAVAHVAELIEAPSHPLTAGTRFDHYEVIREIGIGGMGEVYLAQDTKLDRLVAIKVLNENVSRDGSNLKRFVREAKAASALNHPNILVIHEIGESEGVHFIVSEFIEGKTLREVLTQSQLSYGEVLDVSIQIANALAAAHGAHLVHRDLKPENVMIRPDGYVKVLDFGLAKLVEQEGQAMIGGEDATKRNQTAKGVILGTVNYMSPEQARGLDVDSRTDIWSLGVVLYEMIAGHAPFRGETPSHVIVSILETEPPSFTGCFEALERVVKRLLEKKREDRYQTADDLAQDLKSLKQELEADARLQRSFQVGSAGKERAITSGGTTIVEVTQASAGTLRLEREAPRSSAEYVVGTIRNHKKATIGALAIFLVTVASALALFVFLPLDRSASKPAAPFETIEFQRLTNSGRVEDAVISLDGKYVAYVAENGGRKSIWLMQVTTSNKIEIVPPAEKQFYGSTFSRDSNYLYYIVKERNNSIGVLYRVPVLGGASAKLIVDVDGPISLSPDGTQFTFVRGSTGGERALMIANADGSGERKLSSRIEQDAFSFGGPAWSPDGKRIAVGAAKTNQSPPHMSVVAVSVADGTVTSFTAQKWRDIGRLAWLQDGKGLVLTASDLGRRSPSQLWYLSYPNGEARRITKDLQDYDGVSLTSDSTAIVSNQTQTMSGIWTAPNDDANAAKQILSNKYDGYGFGYYSRFSWMPDGQIIYTSLIHSTPSIWVMTAQGTKNVQMTPDSSSNNFPSVTSDSRYIVFLSDRTGFTNVWRMDIDGGNEKQLTKGEDESWAWCSPDSRWIVYHSGGRGRRTLWRVSVEGDNPEQLTDYPSTCPVVSPDGRWITCYYRAATKAPWKLAIIPFDGGPPVKTFEVPQHVTLTSLVRWTPDGAGLAYITNLEGVSNIWIQPLDGTSPKQLTHFKSDQIFWFDWSSDGRQLGVSRGTVTSDVLLIKDQRSIFARPST